MNDFELRSTRSREDAVLLFTSHFFFSIQMMVYKLMLLQIDTVSKFFLTVMTNWFS